MRVKELEALLEAGVQDGIFPVGEAAVASAATAWEVVTAFAGRVPDKQLSMRDNIFDLASLTKPVVALCALQLVAEKKVSLATRLSKVYDDLGPYVDVELGELLSHRAGLPAHSAFYGEVAVPASKHALRTVPASRAVQYRHHVADLRQQIRGGGLYSDIGFVLLGQVVSALSGQPLSQLVSERIAQPLELELGFPEEVGGTLRIGKSAVPTQICPWRERRLDGEVHDQNCAALGGIAGHAGLFGTATALARLGVALLDPRKHPPQLSAEHIRLATARQPGSSFGLGWDTKSEVGSSAGTRMSSRTFGHLGFTGTSIWCDPEHKCVVALLTNRVYHSRDSAGIRKYRPWFHDEVMKRLLSN